MQPLPPIDFQAIKSSFDLESTITKYLGQPEKKDKWLCPFHKEDTPSFGLWCDGERFKCFGCGAEGDIIDFIRLHERLGNNGQAARKLAGEGYVLDLDLTPAEIKARKAEYETERKRIKEERQQQRVEREQAALKQVSSLADLVSYYYSQVESALPYWNSQGIGRQLIESYRFGYAPLCPLLYPSEVKQASYVIPYYESGELVSIRHRLSQPNGHGKYRPQFAGLPPRLFNVDSLKIDMPFALNEGEFIIVEGEIKSVVLCERLGCPVVGLPGASNWRDEWADYFKNFHTAYWIPDPGLKPDIKDRVIGLVANGLKETNLTVVICSMSVKPDDYFVRWHGGVERFCGYLQRGRVYNGK